MVMGSLDRSGLAILMEIETLNDSRLAITMTF